MKPDLARHRPDPSYLRALIAAVGRTQEEVADALGVSRRAMRYYLSTAKDHRDAPYVVQYAIEGLAPATVLSRLNVPTTDACNEDIKGARSAAGRS